MKISRSLFVLVLLSCTFLFQRCSPDDVSITSTECTVARVAERYIASHYPDFDSIESPPIVRDIGNAWEVKYRLPSDRIGGTPVVVIEKATLKVLRSYQTQ